MRQYVSASEIQNGAHYVQRKRKPELLALALYKEFVPRIADFQSHISKVRRRKGESVAAFRHKAGRGPLCPRCYGGIE